MSATLQRAGVDVDVNIDVWLSKVGSRAKPRQADSCEQEDAPSEGEASCATLAVYHFTLHVSGIKTCTAIV